MADRDPNLDAFRKAVRLEPGVVSLNNAGIGPLLVPGKAAADHVTDVYGKKGFLAWDEIQPKLDDGRSATARMLGVEQDQVALMPSTSAALSQVALGLQLTPEDEILIWDQEYPSNAYPWYAAARRADCQIRTVASENGYTLNAERFLTCMSRKTKIVAVSWVQYQTGEVSDLKTISAACRRFKAALVVDVIQGLGVIPFSMKAYGVDIACGGYHKWLCSPVGGGFMAFANPDVAKKLYPIMHGAFNYGTPEDLTEPDRGPKDLPSERFESGFPNMVSAAAAGASLRYIQKVGVEKIYKEALRLADRLRAELTERECEILSPARPDRETSVPRSPIVTFRPACDLDALAESFQKHKIAFSRRAGGLRLSPHGYNTDEDIDWVLAAYDETE